MKGEAPVGDRVAEIEHFVPRRTASGRGELEWEFLGVKELHEGAGMVFLCQVTTPGWALKWGDGAKFPNKQEIKSVPCYSIIFYVIQLQDTPLFLFIWHWYHYKFSWGRSWSSAAAFIEPILNISIHCHLSEMPHYYISLANFASLGLMGCISHILSIPFIFILQWKNLCNSKWAFCASWPVWHHLSQIY